MRLNSIVSFEWLSWSSRDIWVRRDKIWAESANMKNFELQDVDVTVELPLSCCSITLQQDRVSSTSDFRSTNVAVTTAARMVVSLMIRDCHSCSAVSANRGEP
ncbi:hypothetical protein QYF36_014764 [Acer negundo]|nr:hypothetical protein QYF36_014764 [Acer negundo]